MNNGERDLSRLGEIQRINLQATPRREVGTKRIFQGWPQRPVRVPRASLEKSPNAPESTLLRDL
jgi:hypothetical protein